MLERCPCVKYRITTFINNPGIQVLSHKLENWPRFSWSMASKGQQPGQPQSQVVPSVWNQQPNKDSRQSILPSTALWLASVAVVSSYCCDLWYLMRSSDSYLELICCHHMTAMIELCCQLQIVQCSREWSHWSTDHCDQYFVDLSVETCLDW